MTLHETPPAGTLWPVRKLAKAVGLSPSGVQRIWAAHGLKPRLTKTFKRPIDKRFAEKRDTSGAISTLPDRALVLCIDGKSQRKAARREAVTLAHRADSEMPLVG